MFGSLATLPAALDGLASYSRTLDAIGKMKDAVDASESAQIDLPMLCVVGDQTSGKSSLLEALTGVHFPVKSGTCTRVPITVRCRRADEEGVWLMGPDSKGRKLEPAKVAIEISKEQKAVIGDAPGDSRVPIGSQPRF
jgi:energy-coupling factor transporter ATP-binding protein EcfA2